MSKRARVLLALFSLLTLFGTLLARPPSDGLRNLVANGATLVDVRTTEEFAAGHLRGAVNLPVAELRDRLAELGPRGLGAMSNW